MHGRRDAATPEARAYTEAPRGLPNTGHIKNCGQYRIKEKRETAWSTLNSTLSMPTVYWAHVKGLTDRQQRHAVTKFQPANLVIGDSWLLRGGSALQLYKRAA